MMSSYFSSRWTGRLLGLATDSRHLYIPVTRLELLKGHLVMVHDHVLLTDDIAKMLRHMHGVNRAPFVLEVALMPLLALFGQIPPKEISGFKLT